jgi:molecular chaperone Hsp33
MKNRDSLQRFLFEQLPVRGEIVHLNIAWRTVLIRRDYPAPIRRLLGEAMVAATLLSGVIKFRGLLTLQLQGQGPLSLLLVQYTSEHTLRGLARWQGPVNEERLCSLCESGTLAVTIDPGQGLYQYQGLVELSGPSLAASLETYFSRSEQLSTHLQLVAHQHAAAGILLQRLPGQAMDTEDWQRLSALSATLTDTELLNLNAQSIIHRLFHKEDVRLFEAQPITFRCSCSRERTESMLRALGQEEIKEILAEQEMVTVTCEFCGMRYEFDRVDAQLLFTPSIQPGVSGTRH